MVDMVLNNDEARVNVTWDGQNGDLQDPVYFESTDGDLRAMVTEAVQNGDVPGINADPNANFTDFVVDRFRATEDNPVNRIAIRPKTPFGNNHASVA